MWLNVLATLCLCVLGYDALLLNRRDGPSTALGIVLAGIVLWAVWS
jgi:hypothetical protein